MAFRKVADPATRLLYATQTPEWNERMATMVDMDQIMMVEGMEPPSTHASELAVWAELDGELLDRKVAALRSQASQVEPLYQQMGAAGFALLAVKRHPLTHRIRADPILGRGVGLRHVKIDNGANREQTPYV